MVQVELFASITTKLLAMLTGPAVEALYPVATETFSEIMFALILTIPWVSAERYGLVTTLPPRYVNSMLPVPDAGATVNTICPLISAYVSVLCFIPDTHTITDASLPYEYVNVNVVAAPVPEKYSDTIDPPTSWLPK